jgi:hypothetical protein
MTIEELESLRRDIEGLQRAVRKANPFLRSVVELRVYALLSIPFGAFVLAFCLAAHFLVRSFSSLQALPSVWKTVFWLAFALFLAGAWVLKWLVLGRRAAQVEKGATIFTAVRALYGGGWFHISLPVGLSMFVLGAFALVTGHPWFIVSIFAIGLGLVCNSLGSALERREFLVTGWYALVSGLAALFFLETAPFLCLAAVWAGIFFVYAASGLCYLPREGKA